MSVRDISTGHNVNLDLSQFTKHASRLLLLQGGGMATSAAFIVSPLLFSAFLSFGYGSEQGCTDQVGQFVSARAINMGILERPSSCSVSFVCDAGRALLVSCRNVAVGPVPEDLFIGVRSSRTRSTGPNATLPHLHARV